MHQLWIKKIKCNVDEKERKVDLVEKTGVVNAMASNRSALMSNSAATRSVSLRTSMPTAPVHDPSGNFEPQELLSE